jgi:hypothetical protein
MKKYAAAFTCALTAVRGIEIVPAPQTVVQHYISARTRAAAVGFSAEASDSVLALFGASETKAFLEHFDDGSGLYLLSAEDLLARFWQELSVAELVHNFGNDLAEANCGADLSLSQGASARFFPNQWELQATGQMPVDAANNAYMEWSETNLFGFPPFANLSAPDIQTVRPAGGPPPPTFSPFSGEPSR